MKHKKFVAYKRKKMLELVSEAFRLLDDAEAYTNSHWASHDPSCTSHEENIDALVRQAKWVTRTALEELESPPHHWGLPVHEPLPGGGE